MLSIGVGLAYLVMTWSTIIDLRVARLPTRTEKERFTLLYTKHTINLPHLCHACGQLLTTLVTPVRCPHSLQTEATAAYLLLHVCHFGAGLVGLLYHCRLHQGLLGLH